MKKIGVVLSGCGYLDGAEIREAVLTALHIDEAGCEAVFLAPKIPQHHVVDHVAGEEVPGPRSVFLESSRIARGKIQDLDEVDAKSLDALIIPGGFGVAKNLSTFAFDGTDASVNPNLEKLILTIHQQQKPIGAICIAPAVIALLLGKDGAQLTIGNDAGTAKAIESTGAEHIKTGKDEICIDENMKIVSTPAYMYDDARLSEVNRGIGALVDEVVGMMP